MNSNLERIENTIRIVEWKRELDLCGPNCERARAIYDEAIKAGVAQELIHSLEDDAAYARTQAELLSTEMTARWPAK